MFFYDGALDRSYSHYRLMAPRETILFIAFIPKKVQLIQNVMDKHTRTSQHHSLFFSEQKGINAIQQTQYVVLLYILYCSYFVGLKVLNIDKSRWISKNLPLFPTSRPPPLFTLLWPSCIYYTEWKEIKMSRYTILFTAWSKEGEGC